MARFCELLISTTKLQTFRPTQHLLMSLLLTLSVQLTLKRWVRSGRISVAFTRERAILNWKYLTVDAEK